MDGELLVLADRFAQKADARLEYLRQYQWIATGWSTRHVPKKFSLLRRRFGHSWQAVNSRFSEPVMESFSTRWRHAIFPKTVLDDFTLIPLPGAPTRTV